MIEAARRYNRVVAVGTQRRSAALVAKAVQFLREATGHDTLSRRRRARPRRRRARD